MDDLALDAVTRLAALEKSQYTSLLEARYFGQPATRSRWLVLVKESYHPAH
jgi:hypothetical protein